MTSCTASAASGRQAQRAGSAEGAGLVPYKTILLSDNPSSEICINLSPAACAERRIKRLKRSVWASGHLHGLAEKGFRPSKVWFVTLTYRPGLEWGKKDLSEASQRYRNWCRGRRIPCRYTWVAELQNRGAVHYHLLAWLPVGVRMPMWDRRTVNLRGVKSAAFWPHGMTQRAEALSGVGYLMKYLSKLGEFHRFPKGLRLYGIGGLNEIGRSVRRWHNLPEWCKSLHGVGEVLRRACGLVVQATGEVLESPFEVSRMPFGLLVRAVRAVPARWFDGAYSSMSFA